MYVLDIEPRASSTLNIRCASEQHHSHEARFSTVQSLLHLYCTAWATEKLKILNKHFSISGNHHAYLAQNLNIYYLMEFS